MAATAEPSAGATAEGSTEAVDRAASESALLAPEGVLRVSPWHDPVVGAHGVDVRSGYVERFWLPVLGPSAVLALRRLADYLDLAPDGVDVDLEETARSLGVGGSASRHSPLRRALERCVRFGLARHRGAAALEVRRAVGPLPQRHLLRLPPTLQVEHDRWAARQPEPEALETARRRARLLALDLLDVTGERGLVEWRLTRWGVHPALAAECATWAWKRMAEASLTALPGG